MPQRIVDWPNTVDRPQTSLGYTNNPVQQALSQVIDMIRSQAGSGSQQPWGFHEPTITAGAGVEAGLNKAGEILGDPRNAWIGLGPIAGMMKPVGWGAEVLRRYKLLGGTPQTLQETLMRRGVHPAARNEIVQGFRAATDIAAPNPPREALFDQSISTLQHLPMQWAGERFVQEGQGLRNMPRGLGLVESIQDAGFYKPAMESAASGNAAYGAVSRQVARMLDSPEYRMKRPGYGPEPVVFREDIMTPELARQFARERGYNISR